MRCHRPKRGRAVRSVLFWWRWVESCKCLRASVDQEAKAGGTTWNGVAAAGCSRSAYCGASFEGGGKTNGIRMDLARITPGKVASEPAAVRFGLGDLSLSERFIGCDSGANLALCLRERWKSLALSWPAVLARRVRPDAGNLQKLTSLGQSLRSPLPVRMRGFIRGGSRSIEPPKYGL
jgi:hypothetical protein